MVLNHTPCGVRITAERTRTWVRGRSPTYTIVTDSTPPPSSVDSRTGFFCRSLTLYGLCTKGVTVVTRVTMKNKKELVL